MIFLKGLILFAAILLSKCSAISNSDFGHPFNILPSENNWQSMAQEMDAKNITSMVKAYIGPFAEYQAAARNFSISSEQLKDNVIAAIELVLEASKTFIVPPGDFSNTKTDLEALLKLPDIIFSLKRVERAAPTFSAPVLRAFTRQRLTDMIIHKKSFMNYQVSKYQFELTLKEWTTTATRLPACRFRTLMPRNLDMPYIEHMMGLYLDVMRLRAQKYPDGKLPMHKQMLMKIHKDQLLKNMEMLGNGYAVSKPPYSAFMILVTTLYALLVTLMI